MISVDFFLYYCSFLTISFLIFLFNGFELTLPTSDLSEVVKDRLCLFLLNLLVLSFEFLRVELSINVW
jgi:hypothetical protein